jgi:hypothetical protein
VAAVSASSYGAGGYGGSSSGSVGGAPLHPVLVFDVNAEEGRSVLRGPPLAGHVGVVHALAWSSDDKFLLSASGDGTARVLKDIQNRHSSIACSCVLSVKIGVLCVRLSWWAFCCGAVGLGVEHGAGDAPPPARAGGKGSRASPVARRPNRQRQRQRQPRRH